jgi:outer membrane protein assembly factor BamB
MRARPSRRAFRVVSCRGRVGGGIIAGAVMAGAFVAAALAAAPVHGDEWPQFRGPATGVRAGGGYPAEIGPRTNVVWKTPLPPGHSSPVVHGDRVYVTAVADGRLLTIGLDRGDGRILWRAEAPVTTPEKVHAIGSLAQPSPATDGRHVVSFFGSSGLACHDRDGGLLWRLPMGPFNNDFGAGTSPIIVGDLVILCQDHDSDSFLLAVDKRTGETVWRTDRGEFPRNYCSPVLWNAGPDPQIVVAATLRVVGYDLRTGREAWTVRGISRTVCATPAVGADGTLYVAAWSAGGDAGDIIRLPPWEEAVGQDADGDGRLREAELPAGDVRQRFSQIDRSNDDAIDRAEYDYFRMLFETSRNAVTAIRPGADGEATDTHVAWRQEKHVPFCASPVAVGDTLFTVRDGGILASLDARTGRALKVARLPHSQDYYASPVAADGKIYLANEAGQVTVVTAEPEWRVVHEAEFGEDVFATPALADGRIYLRTAGHLWCLAAGGKGPP